MGLLRALKHALTPTFVVHRRFPASALAAIEAAVRAAEANHAGQIRVALEAALPAEDALLNRTPRDRALEVFAQLGVWDTQANNGVLIYVNIADRDMEIVADRGIHAKAGSGAWETICQAMEAKFRAGDFPGGVIIGVGQVAEQLAAHFPRSGDSPANELPDAPVVLR
jgi:uncharacterized membrane protein